MKRVERLREKMAAESLPAMLIQNPLNVGYLSGFTGSTAHLLVSPCRAIFITDSRYAIQAAKEAPGWEMVVTTSSAGYTDTLVEQIRALEVSPIGLEAEYVTLAGRDALAAKLEGVELKGVEALVSNLRRVKDAEELAILREACGIADRAFNYILTQVRPGVTERELALDLNLWMMRHGAEKEGFETIVVSGERSALPHGKPSDKPIQAGDFVTFDFGARVRGYTSDLTRTVVVGEATARQREVYDVVLRANQAGIAALAPGVAGKTVDSAARDLIGAAGLGQYFGHGLGHGLGRHVHDHQCLGQTIEITLEPGMVTTIEPGVYIEGWGGVRIEDDVLITESGPEALTHAPKALIELPVA
jgi:Xaa-Pro aminopeptidase